MTHYSFLDEFTLLRNHENNILEQPWADPVFRETMRKYQRLQRAHEEVIRCNVGIRRLHTSIVDENKSFSHILSSLELSDDPLRVEIEDFVTWRRAVNNVLLLQLSRTYSLPGFSGNPTPGIRKRDGNTLGEPSTPNGFGLKSTMSIDSKLSVVEPHTTSNAEFSDDEEDELDNEAIREIGGVVDYLTNLT